MLRITGCVANGSHSEGRCSIEQLTKNSMSAVNTGNAVNVADKSNVTNMADKPQTFRKRVGSTVYEVTIHFSQTSKETAEDKLKRLIKREVESCA